MSRVAAYHTARPETGGERNVYHNDDECPRGKEISKEDCALRHRWSPPLQGLQIGAGR